ncbi:MAG TPA: malto-oligosyltrehalose trehalohydrolase [Thermoanaerobaculia bacterium]|nr:malto-oligosyltrehalose trehalohydrolase [Thermoanaerobaculia bacterium]
MQSMTAVVTSKEAGSDVVSEKKGFQRALGSVLQPGGDCRFRVWAPWQDRLEVHLVSPADELVEMSRRDGGYFESEIKAGEGTRYFYRLSNGNERPDPASRYQPETVHGPTEIVSADFPWTDGGWRGLPLARFVIYEMHAGTFTPDGTFDAAIAELPRLRDLGITAIEIMPVAQFPGRRNWGYDGVYPSAAQNSYGGPSGLKRLVDAIHGHGMAAILDVVYNHLGPEGNYLSEFGPYFTDRYKTLWGLALNFDGPESDEVRGYFIESALGWIAEFHLDALRIDAVHAIVDHSAFPFLAELTEAVHDLGESLGRAVHVIAESDLNDPALLAPAEQGGFAMDAQWSDDFHHALHTVLTGEKGGYYADFGSLEDLAVVYRRAFRYAGDYSGFRRRRYGALPAGLEATRFVVCAQNHDQIGNRMKGDRLAASLTDAQLRLAAAAVILSPFIPMLFMGEEYGESAPFLYFTSHSDRDLVEAVTKGRREEFSAFGWQGDLPDPDAEETFLRSRLDAGAQSSRRGQELSDFYRMLMTLRREEPALDSADLSSVKADVIGDSALVVSRSGTGGQRSLLILNFGDARFLKVPGAGGSWRASFISSESGLSGGARLEADEELTIRIGDHEASLWIQEKR